MANNKKSYKIVANYNISDDTVTITACELTPNICKLIRSVNVSVFEPIVSTNPVTDTINTTVDTTKKAAEDVKSQVVKAAEEAKEKASQAAEAAKEEAKRAASKFIL